MADMLICDECDHEAPCGDLKPFDPCPACEHRGPCPTCDATKEGKMRLAFEPDGSVATYEPRKTEEEP